MCTSMVRFFFYSFFYFKSNREYGRRLKVHLYTQKFDVVMTQNSERIKKINTVSRHKIQRSIFKQIPKKFTKILSAFVLVDVHVDLLDGLHGLSQLGSIGVALRRGAQQLRQQQRVAHHPLHRLDQEGAEVDVISFTPTKQPKKRGNLGSKQQEEDVKSERFRVSQGSHKVIMRIVTATEY